MEKNNESPVIGIWEKMDAGRKVVWDRNDIGKELEKVSFNKFLEVMAAYLKSRLNGDNLMMTRTLQNGKVEISGNGYYLTVDKDVFEQEMEKFNSMDY